MVDPSDPIQSGQDLFEQYLNFDALGMRKEAKRAVDALVDTLSDAQAKEAWTRTNLHRLARNSASRVRHEIFRHIVFPTIKAAYDRGDAEARYLFGKYSQNLYSDRALFDQMGGRVAMDFFEEAFHADPNSVLYQDAFLGSLIGELQHLFHEWPIGILIDHDDWRKGMDGLKAQLSMAQSLDRNGTYSDLLARWRACTEEYESRLSDGKAHQ